MYDPDYDYEDTEAAHYERQAEAAREREEREELDREAERAECLAADREAHLAAVADEDERFRSALRAAGGRQYTDDSWMKPAPFFGNVKTRRAA